MRNRTTLRSRTGRFFLFASSVLLSTSLLHGQIPTWVGDVDVEGLAEETISSDQHLVRTIRGNFTSPLIPDVVCLQESATPGDECEIWVFKTPAKGCGLDLLEYTANDCDTLPRALPDGRSALAVVNASGLGVITVNYQEGDWQLTPIAGGDWANAKKVRCGALGDGLSYYFAGVKDDDETLLFRQSDGTAWSLSVGATVIDLLPLDFSSNGDASQDQLVVITEDGLQIWNVLTQEKLVEHTGLPPGPAPDLLHRLDRLGADHSSFIWIDHGPQYFQQYMYVVDAPDRFEGPHLLNCEVTGLTVADGDGDYDQDLFITCVLFRHLLRLENLEEAPLPPDDHTFSTSHLMLYQQKDLEGELMTGPPPIPLAPPIGADLDGDGDDELFSIANDAEARLCSVFVGGTHAADQFEVLIDLTDVRFTERTGFLELPLTYATPPPPTATGLYYYFARIDVFTEQFGNVALHFEPVQTVGLDVIRPQISIPLLKDDAIVLHVGYVWEDLWENPVFGPANGYLFSAYDDVYTEICAYFGVSENGETEIDVVCTNFCDPGDVGGGGEDPPDLPKNPPNKQPDPQD